MNENYDIFISYSTKDSITALKYLDSIESFGYKCFIAPRDIRKGHDYAAEIVRGITSAKMVLFIFSKYSNDSSWVLREINSAISRGIKVLCLRTDDTKMCPALEFYLSINQWVDENLTFENQIKQIIDLLKEIKGTEVEDEEEKTIKIPGPIFLDNSELLERGYTAEEITMREIELDYLAVPKSKYDMDSSIEGTIEDWTSSVSEFGDASFALVANDKIYGHMELYPVYEDDFKTLIDGKEIINETMIALYSIPGDYDVYIPLICIEPDSAYHKQSVYLDFFKEAYRRLIKWEEDEIVVRNIGVSIYSSITEKYVKVFGFKYVGLNPAGGKIYTTTYTEFKEHIKKVLRIN